MAFIAPLPNQTYHPKVEIAFGYTMATVSSAVFTDVTKYVRVGLGPVTLSGGRSSLGAQADPAQITLTLDNTDGRFTARSAYLRNGQPNPYFPNVVRNVPIRVRLTWDRATDPPYELLTTFVNGWPIEPTEGTIVLSAPIAASGRLYRMRRSNKTLFSALRRFVQLNIFPDAYW